MRQVIYFLSLNLTRIAELQPVPYLIRDKEDLVKHIRKRTIQTGRLFFSSSLNRLLTHLAVEILHKRPNKIRKEEKVTASFGVVYFLCVSDA